MNAKNVTTYTIRLCKNGKEFRVVPNVAATGSLPTAGTVLDVGDNDERKWKVCGVISISATEIVVDVEEVTK
jgi:hypothetical protein